MSKQAKGAGEKPAAPAATDEPTPPDDPSPQHSTADPGVIAERLQYLFENKRKPDGKKYSYREAIRAIEDAGGASISVGYLSQLVNGVRTNPMMDAVQGLAKFFGVPLSYFDEHEDTEETNDQLKLVAALQHAGVQDVAMRTVGLPPESVKLVLSMIDRVREVEGLPPAESPPDTGE
ncbi:helix-turn-helix transcriptional regulator [Catenulispora sp. NL8]|uniref:Helix-turn-helix transcriptional regulator n=1 Tax=Catenulispora pinistramenti TaxID=2705254 RepID=A0ABS5KLJ0_9ACTN|nr:MULTISPECIES: helix-turn-helix domain-containing protein [Catenulispora]MBS2546908.1 helix-turn-helix transcriptional regulator [Catenulispora pinistramenti]